MAKKQTGIGEAVMILKNVRFEELGYFRQDDTKDKNFGKEYYGLKLMAQYIKPKYSITTQLHDKIERMGLNAGDYIDLTLKFEYNEVIKTFQSTKICLDVELSKAEVTE